MILYVKEPLMPRKLTIYDELGDAAKLSSFEIWKRKRYFTKRFTNTANDLRFAKDKNDALSNAPRISTLRNTSKKIANLIGVGAVAGATAANGVVGGIFFTSLNYVDFLTAFIAMSPSFVVGAVTLENSVKYAWKADAIVDFLQKRNASRIRELTSARDIHSQEYGPDVFIQDGVIAVVADTLDQIIGRDDSKFFQFIDNETLARQQRKRRETIHSDYLRSDLPRYNQLPMLEDIWELIDGSYARPNSPGFSFKTICGIQWAIDYVSNIENTFYVPNNPEPHFISLILAEIRKDLVEKKEELVALAGLVNGQEVSEQEIDPQAGAEIDALEELFQSSPSHGPVDNSKSANGITVIGRIKVSRLAKPPAHGFHDLMD